MPKTLVGLHHTAAAIKNKRDSILKLLCSFVIWWTERVSRDSAVGIATGYGLDD
jgi:hypothetical protein